jgi:ammonia channel protein AmtB
MVIFFKRYLFIISILNSFYLSYINLKGFLLEQNLSELEKAFTVNIFTNPFILLVLFYIGFIRKKKNLEISGRNFLLIFVLLILTVMIGFFIYNALQSNSSSLYAHIASILFEIISISLAISKERQQKILDLVSYFSLCFLTAVLSFSLIGFLEKYFYEVEIDNKLIIVYTATFFHFFNSCFLLYKSIPVKMKMS